MVIEYKGQTITHLVKYAKSINEKPGTVKRRILRGSPKAPEAVKIKRGWWIRLRPEQVQEIEQHSPGYTIGYTGKVYGHLEAYCKIIGVKPDTMQKRIKHGSWLASPAIFIQEGWWIKIPRPFIKRSWFGTTGPIAFTPKPNLGSQGFQAEGSLQVTME